MGENLGEFSDTYYSGKWFSYCQLEGFLRGQCGNPSISFILLNYFNLEKEVGCSLIKPGDNSRLGGTQGPLRRTSTIERNGVIRKLQPVF